MEKWTFTTFKGNLPYEYQYGNKERKLEVKNLVEKIKKGRDEKWVDQKEVKRN